MDSENNKTMESMKSTDTTQQEISGYFIEDESHLRLSYYRENYNFDDSIDSFASAQSTSFQADQQQSVLDRSDIRRKISEYVSQMPDLPHPSETVTSIITSASRKMGMVNLRYNNKIELGKKESDAPFSPNRRSTMNPRSTK
ncbi:unnamed protein product [Diatraea saccharalis]|uniref:Uncharacterized protein n=1 Tax=Diatraea saccharalis TaxID=40085 RepID=A0A9N9WE41_9NEOP|nr:unnamed protein product [Diatraea saccharalis]